MKLLFQNLLFQSPLVTLFCLATILISLHYGNAVNLPNNETVPAFIAFGDSIVDSGNNNYIINTVFKCNFPPYGKDFGGGNQPTGRFSNGLVPSDIIGTKINLFITIVLNCSADCNLKPFIHGRKNRMNNFFSSFLRTSSLFFSASKFGVKKLLPAYLDPNLQLQDLLTGVSFASGGSGYDPLTSKSAVNNNYV